MRIKTHRLSLRCFIFLIILSGGFSPSAFALDLSDYKKTCAEIGFKPGTEKHGNCVLKLFGKAKNQINLEKQEQERRDQAAQEAARQDAIQREILANQQRMVEIERERLAMQQKEAERANRQRQAEGWKNLFDTLSRATAPPPPPKFPTTYDCYTYGNHTSCSKF
jgi:hypothetical protein